MKASAFLCATLLTVLPLVKSDQCVEVRAPHDQIHPYEKPEETTESEKAAARYQPSLHSSHGCDPYAAVDAEGRTSGGLKATGDSRGKCGQSYMGGQVYARGEWWDKQFGIVYAWYFPKDSVRDGIGHRYDWEWATIWLNNPEANVSEIRGVTTIGSGGPKRTDKLKPENRVGDTVKLDYRDHGRRHFIALSGNDGQLQPLIMWDQMTEASRCAFNTVGWNKHRLMPLADTVFEKTLATAYGSPATKGDESKVSQVGRENHEGSQVGQENHEGSQASQVGRENHEGSQAGRENHEGSQASQEDSEESQASQEDSEESGESQASQEDNEESGESQASQEDSEESQASQEGSEESQEEEASQEDSEESQASQEDSEESGESQPSQEDNEESGESQASQEGSEESQASQEGSEESQASQEGSEEG
uniref:Nep1-like protein n=1 Tax=Hyaloperonospora arabidopsidis TaxID=272952 RepID=H6W1B9_HYAAB|nr:Nep1-like protein [Hyaloperonospora arabidopsidis]